MFVIPSVHNKSVTGWKKVRTHLRGIWRDGNEFLELVQLKRLIWNLMQQKLLKTSWNNFKKPLHHDHPLLPYWEVIAGLGIYVLLGIICLPVIIKLLVNSQWKDGSEMHGVNLCILI